MLDIYTIMNSESFNEKLQGLFAKYEDTKLIFDAENQSYYYGMMDRMEALDDTFEGELFINAETAPRKEGIFVVSKATLYMATEDGVIPLVSRFGRASIGLMHAKQSSDLDLSKYAENSAKKRLLEAMGMPSNDIRKTYDKGEYDMLTYRLEQLKITLETALIDYNTTVDKEEELKKQSINDLTLSEVKKVLENLSAYKVADEA